MSQRPPSVPQGGERIVALAAALSHGVAFVRDGCITWASERLTETAARGAALVGTKLADLFADAGDGIPRAGGPDALECWLERPDERRTVVCRLAWEETDEAPAAWVIEDLTHLRVLERELLRCGQELSLANREVTSLRERLRAERHEREELLSVVSHELRTPVTVIGGYNRLLLTGEVGSLTEEQARFLEESNKSCRRLDLFIGNLLEASRAAKGDEILEIGHGPIAPVIENVAGMFRPLLSEQSITLELDLDTSVPRVRFDPLRVEQILTNLMGTALRYAGTGGTIEITTREVDSGLMADDGRRAVEIAVSDDGPGVDFDDRERIFRPYVQAGEESCAGGLGLGLAICKRLVEAHGGSISLGERPGGGARFAFTLPAERDTPAGAEA